MKKILFLTFILGFYANSFGMHGHGFKQEELVDLLKKQGMSSEKISEILSQKPKLEFFKSDQLDKEKLKDALKEHGMSDEEATTEVLKRDAFLKELEQKLKLEQKEKSSTE